MVVRVVIRIGRRRILPASTRASSRGICSFSWLTVSTSRMPLLTAIPMSMRKPIMDTMFRLLPVTNSSRKEPIREKGIQVMTIREKRGDSNCMAITRKTRKIPARIELKIAVRFSPRISSIRELDRTTSPGNSISAALRVISLVTSPFIPSAAVAETVFWILPPVFWII